jgi:hypothetical protein
MVVWRDELALLRCAPILSGCAINLSVVWAHCADNAGITSLLDHSASALDGLDEQVDDAL